MKSLQMTPKLKKIAIWTALGIILVMIYVAYIGEPYRLFYITAKTLNNNSFTSIFGLVAAALIAGWFGIECKGCR